MSATKCRGNDLWHEERRRQDGAAGRGGLRCGRSPAGEVVGTLWEGWWEGEQICKVLIAHDARAQLGEQVRNKDVAGLPSSGRRPERENLPWEQRQNKGRGRSVREAISKSVAWLWGSVRLGNVESGIA